MRNELKTDKEWEARYDAESLIRAEEIKQDKTRFTKAKVQARKIAQEKVKEANAAKRIAKRTVQRTRKKK